MPTRNINLTDRFDRFIEAEVGSGRYGSASEVVREGLRLMEARRREEQARFKWLRGAVKTGIDQMERGEFESFESPADLTLAMDRLEGEASAELQKRRRTPA